MRAGGPGNHPNWGSPTQAGFAWVGAERRPLFNSGVPEDLFRAIVLLSGEHTERLPDSTPRFGGRRR